MRFDLLKIYIYIFIENIYIYLLKIYIYIYIYIYIRIVLQWSLKIVQKHCFINIVCFGLK